MEVQTLSNVEDSEPGSRISVDFHTLTISNRNEKVLFELTKVHHALSADIEEQRGHN
jgi:hypothetical protein